MQDGVAENLTAAMLEPYLRRAAAATTRATPGLSFVDPARCAATSPSWTPPASRCTSTRSATGPCARRSTRSRRRAPPTADAATGTTSRTCRSCTRDDVPRFAAARRDREHPAAVGLPRAADGRADHPVPRRGAAPSGSTRSARCSRAGAHARRGQRLAGQQPRPAAGHPRRGQPGRARGPTERTSRSCRSSALDLATALAAYTAGSAYVNHRDHDTGTLRAGALADLVVLDRDPFLGPSSAIAATRVRQTYVEGERVYDAG